MAEGSSVFAVSFDAAEKKKMSFDKKIFAEIIKDMRRYPLSIFCILVLSAGSAYTFVMIPEYLGKVIDLFVSVFVSSVIKGEADIPADRFIRVLVPTVAVFLLNSLFSLFRDIISANMSSDYSDFLRKRIFDKILSVEMSYIDINSKQSVRENATAHTDMMNQSINIIISQEISSALCIACVIIRLFSINVVFGIFALLILPLTVLINYIIRQIRLISEKAAYKAQLPDFRELYENADALRISGEKNIITESFEKTEEMRIKALCKARFFDSLTKNPSVFLCWCFMIACVVFGADAINEGIVTLGTVISVIIFFLRLSTPFSQISTFSSSVANLFCSADKVFSFLCEEDEQRGDKKDIEEKDLDIIAFNNVTFRYVSGKEDVLKNLSFEIKNKGVTVLAGETGIGKTTLLKLMTGFYMPCGGNITFNGEDINTFDIKAFRDRFSFIEQEAVLFETTVKENIIYPDTEVDSERFEEVISVLGLDKVFSESDNIYDTVFRLNPRNLSDGQIQLILLGRAIYHKKEFIVLDEAFSSVDASLEEHIYSLLKKLSDRHGIIIISHRQTDEIIADNTINLTY